MHEYQPEPDQDNLQNVYVVHGRNIAIRDAMYEFLGSLGLHPITKEAAVKWIEEGSPFAGDVLDIAFRHARAVTVLFTGEEEARLRSELRKSGDGGAEEKFLSQPRMDQIFEAGYALGRFPERTILIQIGQVQLFSDIEGRYMPNFTGKESERKDLMNRLKSVGCVLKENGDLWRSAGDFQQALSGRRTKRKTRREK